MGGRTQMTVSKKPDKAREVKTMYVIGYGSFIQLTTLGRMLKTP